jgi:4-hydroxy-3-polyprenylbenzoate decarboxylase
MRLIVGVSGASGAPLAVEFLKSCQQLDVETHLVITSGAASTILAECPQSVEQVQELASAVYDPGNVGAAIASGSFKTDGMVVIPCSMKTVAGIWSGYSDNLLLRAADVSLKERRNLVLVTRECPLSEIHLRNMTDLARMGVTILPPMLGYYHRPQTLEDVTRQVVGKVLDQFGMQSPHYRRWQG